MEKYICIHGHFYQPPRENPWLEDIELQDSAYPYHDWNERIAAECYAPNTVSRILDGEGSIIGLTNNYARMSFNFGPTLLAWMTDKAPEIYAAILAADRQSQEQFSGHGSAMAQAYSHMTMPWPTPGTSTLRCSGGSGILSTASGGRRRGCGCRKPQWTWRLWIFWLS